MLRLEWTTLIHRSLAILALTVSILLGAVSASTDIDISNLSPGFGKNIVQDLKDNSTWMLIVLGFSSAGIYWFSRYMGPPVVWRQVQYILDEQRDILFGSESQGKPDPVHHHRVTLYKMVNFRWYWPFGKRGWLIPVARCGDVTKSGIPKFKAPRVKPGEAEGVTGLSWETQKTVSVHDLPNINRRIVAKKWLEAYAKATNTSIEWVKNRKKRGRKFPGAILATSLEIHGKVWGVLSIDSRSNDDIRTMGFNTKHFQALHGVLSELLKTTKA